MKNTKSLYVDVPSTLLAVQDAFLSASRTGNKELEHAAESVLSALVLVLRHKQAFLPDDLQEHLDKLGIGVKLFTRKRGTR